MGKFLQHFNEKPSVYKERLSMKKSVLLCLVVSLIVIPVSVTNAAELSEMDTESEAEMRERVYEEVLSGEITNDEDVIKVALEQYQERMNYRARMGTPEVLDDGSLSITQVLDSYTDENGDLIEEVVTTGLLVMDENNNLLRGSFDTNGGAGLSEYSIYATMNVNVTNDTSNLTVRFNWFDTTLTYGTAMTAGSLIQTSQYTPVPFTPYDDITRRISYPSSNVAYHYTPSNKDMVIYNNITCGRICKSTINAGNRSFAFGYSLTDNERGTNGAWETEYN